MTQVTLNIGVGRVASPHPCTLDQPRAVLPPLWTVASSARTCLDRLQPTLSHFGPARSRPTTTLDHPQPAPSHFGPHSAQKSLILGPILSPGWSKTNADGLELVQSFDGRANQMRRTFPSERGNKKFAESRAERGVTGCKKARPFDRAVCLLPRLDSNQ